MKYANCCKIPSGTCLIKPPYSYKYFSKLAYFMGCQVLKTRQSNIE